MSGATAATAAAKVREVQLDPAACPAQQVQQITFAPAPPYQNLDTPADLTVTASMTVPGTPATYGCDVAVVADGAVRSTLRFEVTVAGLPALS